MVENVNFKQVAYDVRFRILGSFKMKTPKEFESLTKDQQMDYYRELFDLHHDACNFLTANLDIDALMTKYPEK